MKAEAEEERKTILTENVEKVGRVMEMEIRRELREENRDKERLIRDQNRKISLRWKVGIYWTLPISASS